MNHHSRAMPSSSLSGDPSTITSNATRAPPRFANDSPGMLAIWAGCVFLEIPRDSSLCHRAVTEFMQYRARPDSTFTRIAQERTQDPRLIQRVVDELMRLIRNHRARGDSTADAEA